MSPSSSPSPSSRTPTPTRMTSPFHYAANPLPLLQRIGPPAVPDLYAGDADVIEEEYYSDSEDYDEGRVPLEGRAASLEPKEEDDLETEDEDEDVAHAPSFPRSITSPAPECPRAHMPPPATALEPPPPRPPPPAAPTAVRDGDPVAAVNASVQVIATVTAPGHIVIAGVVAVSLAVSIAAAWALSFIF